MKINNLAELKDTIETLTTQIDAPSIALSAKMDATEINNFFESVETALNKMYEKLRLLQDLHDFSKEFIQSSFAKAMADLGEVNVDSDIASQEYRNTKVRACVAVYGNPTSVRDRDGSALYQAGVENGKVTPGSAVIRKADPSSSATFTTEVCYRRSPIPASNYKTFYVLENTSGKLPSEKTTFFLSTPVKLNHIDAAAFNSDIESISIICSNGETIDIPVGGTTFAEKEVMAIEITLKSTKRDKIAVEVSDKSSTFTATDKQAVSDVLDSVWETYIAQHGDIEYVLH